MCKNAIQPNAGQNFLPNQIKFLQQLVFAVAFGLFSSILLAQENTQNDSGKININNASAMTLQYIPGIGAAKAESIIELRKQKGGFKSLEELLEVRGIGEKLLESIIKYSTLNGGVSELTQEMIENPPSKKVSSSATLSQDQRS